MSLIPLTKINIELQGNEEREGGGGGQSVVRGGEEGRGRVWWVLGQLR